MDIGNVRRAEYGGARNEASLHVPPHHSQTPTDRPEPTIIESICQEEKWTCHDQVSVQIFGQRSLGRKKPWVAASSPQDLGMVPIAWTLSFVSGKYIRHPQSSVSLRFEAATRMPEYLHTHHNHMPCPGVTLTGIGPANPSGPFAWERQVTCHPNRDML